MDVGLGKTMCIIALYEKRPCKTLVLVPLTIMDQWKTEFSTFAPHINVTEFYGKKRDMTGDIVLSTYSTVMYQYKKDSNTNSHTHDLFLDFDRVVFDESHLLYIVKSTKVEACQSIEAKCRWCVSATPITKNSFATLNGQLKCKCKPFDNFMYQPPTTFNEMNHWDIEKEKMLTVYHQIMDKLFFIHTREGLTHHNIPFKTFNIVEHLVEVPGTLFEHNFLHMAIRTKMTINPDLIKYHKMNQLKNILLLSVTIQHWYHCHITQ